MGQQEKSMYFQALKGLGVEFEKHYRDYTTEELQSAYNKHVEAGRAEPLTAPPEQAQPVAPVAERDPNEMAGQRQNTHDELTPLRTDPETGYIWYQEEVQKKGYAAPRGRRVMKYNDPGYKEQQAQDGEFVETFEVAGDERRPAEVKITLPSYQVGIYKHPNFPWKIHTYAGREGFDLFEIEAYYGGPERVPPEVKRVYVESDLCYDTRSVIQAVEAEHRRLQLAGRVTP